jgi:hypothetical protein
MFAKFTIIRGLHGDVIAILCWNPTIALMKKFNKHDFFGFPKIIK